MTLTEITEMPTTAQGVHESVFLSYQLLLKVKAWLEAGAPPSVVLEMIYDVECRAQDARLRRVAGE